MALSRQGKIVFVALFFVLLLKAAQCLSLRMNHQSNVKSFMVPPLPEKIIVGYANWNQCDDSIVKAVEQGVNVVIWFSINLAVDPEGQPTVTNGPEWDCVADKVAQIRAKGLETVHLISIGGWNSPHPDTSNTAEDVFAHWDRWNREVAARPSQGFFGFDGFDWDIEGNDDPASPFNHFSVECLDLMGRVSELAKEQGYIVAMAPAESYLDPQLSPAFDRSLRHEYDEWKSVLKEPFRYHGRNVYAYLLARYDVFDFITVQLYEGYSHAEYAVSQLQLNPVEVLSNFVRRITSPWYIDFSSDPALHFEQTVDVSIRPERLVIGLANGWAGDGKFLLIYPAQVAAAYRQLQAERLTPRGFAFWNILDEGKASPQRPAEPVFLAHGLNTFMHIRD